MSIQQHHSATLRQEIVSELGLDEFPVRGYRDEDYLQAALAAGYDVADLAAAHDVSKKSIYRAVDEHDIELQKPPSNGPAKRLWELDPETIGSGC